MMYERSLGGKMYPIPKQRKKMKNLRFFDEGVHQLSSFLAFEQVE
jgi:hypothetical protein